jgi:cell division protein FtsZ
MVMPGLINLDFADVRTVMSEMGKAMMGTGEAEGENRAIAAAEKAIANPLLDGVSMKGAKGVIVSIVGGEDMRLMEVDEAASHIKELVDPDANIIWGSAFNSALEGKIRVSVVATGIEADAASAPEPARVFSFPKATKKVETVPVAVAAAPAPGFSVAMTAEPEVAPVLAEGPVFVDPLVEDAPAAIEAEAEIVLTAPEPAAIETPEVVADASDDELLLTPQVIVDDAITGIPIGPTADAEEERPAPRMPAGGGTLFERMSNIARTVAKADHDEVSKDPLDIPRFLNRQNNT